MHKLNRTEWLTVVVLVILNTLMGHLIHLVNSLFPEIHLWRQSLMHELCWMFLHQVWRNVSQQWMLCSEWVPSEWESDKNITIIHITPVHQLTSGEDKSWNKYSIKTSKSSSCLKEELFSLLIQTRWLFWRSGLLWCFYQTLILTAPIHCRASIAETLMQCYISPNYSFISDMWCITTQIIPTQTHIMIKKM